MKVALEHSLVFDRDREMGDEDEHAVEPDGKRPEMRQANTAGHFKVNATLQSS